MNILLNMATDNLAIIISYCSNDRIFIDAMLRECQKIGAKQVVVSVGDHTYDMEDEDIAHIEDLAARHPWVQFVLYPVYPLTEIQNPLSNRKGAYWHNMARIHGCQQLSSEVQWVLFLDADEIPSAEHFKSWYSHTNQGRHQKVFKFANYYYFRDPVLQATSWEDSIMLVPRAACCYPVLMNDLERDGIPMITGLACERNVVHFDTKLPMFHHYSWVRSKEAMLWKVQNWGHKDDTDWESKVEREFEREFNVSTDRDFVHGYKYVKVPNWFGINMY